MGKVDIFVGQEVETPWRTDSALFLCPARFVEGDPLLIVFSVQNLFSLPLSCLKLTDDPFGCQPLIGNQLQVLVWDP